MTTSTTTLPALHDGHAPITLQQAFHEALEAIEGLPASGPEQLISVEGRNFAATDVIAAMLECTDLVPLRTADILASLARRIDARATGGLRTYGDWVDLVQRYCRQHAPSERHREYA